MFWGDRIADEVVKERGNGPLIIRDEKTMSGYAHIGSMLSAGMHGIISESLSNLDVKNTYYFEFNDMDAFDGIPVYLEGKGLEPHLGKSLKDVPSPDASARSYAEFFAKDFKEVILGAGFAPIFDFSSEWYLSGKMDGIIRDALEHADDIRRIMKEVSGADRKPGWLPILAKCPTCGKIATTEATDFDGETVQVLCRVNKVDYINGCGFEGRISPFGGNAKLYWKSEWPAKWKVRNVDIEGAGKDHGTRGGSHDVASHICEEVFKFKTPVFIPHEFFLVGGKKISSSKGLGSTARAIYDLLPVKMFRLSLIGKDIMQQRNFDPEGDSIPVLYDQYDKLAANYWAGIKDDYSRLFEVLHPDKKFPAQKELPRFSQVAFAVQMPHIDIKKEFPNADPAELAKRAEYAKRWLDAYAPEKYVFKLQDSLPETAKSLTPEQKEKLRSVLELIESHDGMPNGEEIHAKLHELKEFKAIYLLFLGKDHGPKAGWFLSVLPKDFVTTRLREAIN